MRILGVTCCCAILIGVISAEKFSTFVISSYDLIVKELRNCPNQGTKLMYCLKCGLTKINKHKQAANVDIALNEGLHDGIWVRLNIAKWEGGAGRGWLSNYFNTKGGPFCKAAQNLMPKLFSRVINSWGYTSCPLPPGNYSSRNLDITPDFEVPVISVAKYRANVIMEKNGTRVGCLQVIVDAVPK